MVIPPGVVMPHLPLHVVFFLLRGILPVPGVDNRDMLLSAGAEGFKRYIIYKVFHNYYYYYYGPNILFMKLVSLTLFPSVHPFRMVINVSLCLPFPSSFQFCALINAKCSRSVLQKIVVVFFLMILSEISSFPIL